MKISKLEDNDALKLLVKDTTPTFINTVRRAVMSYVPTLSVEKVSIYKNDSVLFDELLANRLALVPIKTNLKEYGEKDTLKLTLKSDGPGIVYASEIKSKDPKVKPVYGKTPIAKLLKDQCVELIATAVLGQGTDHTKFSPGLAYYKLKPDVKLNKTVKNPDAVAKSCPVNIFNVKGNNISVNKDHVLKCLLCNQCVELADPSDAIEIEQGPDIVFYAESWGQLTCKEMVMAALEEYENDLTKFEELLKEA